MSVYKNKSGDWEFYFKFKGKRYHRSFKDLSYNEVVAKQEELKVHLRMHGKVPPKPVDYRLSELITDYKNYREIHYSRPKEFDYVIDLFFKIVGNVNVNTITRADIDKYIAQRTGKVSNSAINREMDNIRRIFSLAVENRKLEVNPCANFKKLRIDNPQERFLTKDEEVKLLKVANPTMKNMIILALYTGLRTNELLNLKWEDIFMDIKNAYIYVRKTKNNEPRKVPIIQKVKKVLSELPHTGEYVFTVPVLNTPYKDIRSTFERTVIRAGIPSITFHKLRHTTASRLNELGVDVVVIKEIIGHKDIKTTLRYLHTSENYKISAMDKLDGY